MMLTLKLSYNGELRRAQMYTEQTDLNLQLLQATARSLFSELVETKALNFKWEDEEKDVIMVSSDQELQEALRVMKSEDRKVFKFEIHSITQPETKSVTPEAVHTGVSCDQCGMGPILGPRYKCAVREDYDLCHSCEAKEVQPHPMIKVYTPDQAPTAILIAIRDDNTSNWKGQGRPWWGRRHPGHHHHHHGHHPSGPPPCPPRGPPNGPPAHPAEEHNLFAGAFGGAPFDGPGCNWRKWRGQGRKCGEGGPNNGPAEFASPFFAAAEAFSKAASSNKVPVDGSDPVAAVSPFIAAAEAFAKTMSGEDGAATGGYSEHVVDGDDSAVLDQELLEEAVRRSLDATELDAVAEAAAGATKTTATSKATEAQPPVVEVRLISPVNATLLPPLMQVSKPISLAPQAQPTLTKPMARFVRDVTFPVSTTHQICSPLPRIITHSIHPITHLFYAPTGWHFGSPRYRFYEDMAYPQRRHPHLAREGTSLLLPQNNFNSFLLTNISYQYFESIFNRSVWYVRVETLCVRLTRNNR